MRKIVAFIGSGRNNANISTIVNEITRGASENKVDIIIYHLSDMNIKPCRGCFYCRKNEYCCIKDEMNEIINELKDADAVIIGSPVYMFQISGQVKLLMDRLYPLLSGEPGNYGLRYGNKKAVAVYSQGSPNIDSFKEYFDYNKKSLGLLGLNVIDTLICVNANNMNSATENTELLTKAYHIGKGLFL
ncbi:MAG: flavodoxin family protein [Mobilitalea sp.]